MDEHQDCHVEPIEKPLDHEALARAAVTYLTVSGMGCPRCAIRVNNSLLRLDGVLEANVFLEQGFAAVAYDPDRLKPGDLVQAVAEAGNDGRHHYQARVVTQWSAGEAYRQ